VPPGSATAGGLDHLDEACRRLAIAIEMLCGTGHSGGDLWCALLAAAFDSEKDQTHCAGGNDQNHNHCDDDGGHDFLSDSQLRTCWSYVRGRNCLTGRTAGSAIVSGADCTHGLQAGFAGGPVEQLWALSLPNQDHNVGIEMPVSTSRFHHVQATDSASRSREEITVETPSPRMLTPYSASAISIVRFW